MQVVECSIGGYKIYVFRDAILYIKKNLFRDWIPADLIAEEDPIEEAGIPSYVKYTRHVVPNGTTKRAILRSFGWPDLYCTD